MMWPTWLEAWTHKDCHVEPSEKEGRRDNNWAVFVEAVWDRYCRYRFWTFQLLLSLDPDVLYNYSLLLETVNLGLKWCTSWVVFFVCGKPCHKQWGILWTTPAWVVLRITLDQPWSVAGYEDFFCLEWVVPAFSTALWVLDLQLQADEGLWDEGSVLNHDYCITFGCQLSSLQCDITP